jgi:integrase
MRVLRAVWNVAREHAPGLPEAPTRRLTVTRAWAKPVRRTRVVPRHKLGEFLRAVLAEDNDGIRDYLLTLLLTGLRREEAARLTWQEADLAGATITLAGERVKAGREHILPIPAALLAILSARRARQEERKVAEPDSPLRYVFPGVDPRKPFHNPYKGVTRVSARCGVAFTVHDLRRTFASMAESLGITGYLLKRLMNHSTTADVTGGYVRLDLDTLRGAMERIAAGMLGSLEDGGTVVAFPGRAA